MINSKYPFADWLDGRVWLLRYHLDYTCLALSMQSMLYTAARDQGVLVCTRLVGWEGPSESAGAVLVQAYDKDSTWKPNLWNVSWRKVGLEVRPVENKR